jgi:hypothetical protein
MIPMIWLTIFQRCPKIQAVQVGEARTNRAMMLRCYLNSRFMFQIMKGRRPQIIGTILQKVCGPVIGLCFVGGSSGGDDSHGSRQNYIDVGR